MEEVGLDQLLITHSMNSQTMAGKAILYYPGGFGRHDVVIRRRDTYRIIIYC
jgi:hypothetical protein